MENTLAKQIAQDLDMMEFWSTARWLIDPFFGGDYDKIRLWMQIKNPGLGDLSPEEMIAMGKGAKLIQFIRTQLDENRPAPRTEGE
jgi:hypothetical protein